MNHSPFIDRLLNTVTMCLYATPFVNPLLDEVVGAV